MSWDAVKASFSTAAWVQWWVVFVAATALAWHGDIDGTTWGAIVGGSRIIEHMMQRRAQGDRRE